MSLKFCSFYNLKQLHLRLICCSVTQEILCSITGGVMESVGKLNRYVESKEMASLLFDIQAAVKSFPF